MVAAAAAAAAAAVLIAASAEGAATDGGGSGRECDTTSRESIFLSCFSLSLTCPLLLVPTKAAIWEGFFSVYSFTPSISRASSSRVHLPFLSTWGFSCDGAEGRGGRPTAPPSNPSNSPAPAAAAEEEEEEEEEAEAEDPLPLPSPLGAVGGAEGTPPPPPPPPPGWKGGVSAVGGRR